MMLEAVTQQQLRILAHATSALACYLELRAFPRVAAGKARATQHFSAIANPNLTEMSDWLQQQHELRHEIYVGVNPRSVRRGTKDAVRIYTVCFADIDLGKVGARWDDVLAILPLHPSLVVFSGGGVHVYWCCSISDRAVWESVQRGIFTLLEKFGADKAVVGDEARVLRLVPYPNRKGVLPIPTRIISADSRIRYTADQLKRAFPWAPPPKLQMMQSPTRNTGSGKSRADRCVAYLRRLPDAVQGQGGSKITLQAACECFRFGLDRADAEAVMTWWNVEKSKPEWSPRELSHKLADAEKKVLADQSFGIRLSQDRRPA